MEDKPSEDENLPSQPEENGAEIKDPDQLMEEEQEEEDEPQEDEEVLDSDEDEDSDEPEDITSSEEQNEPLEEDSEEDEELLDIEEPEDPKDPPEEEKNVIPRLIEDEMKASYIDYAMSVIVGRALPSVQDGLKPVHRRILFAMHDMGMLHNKPFKKSARIVGEVLGKYHPHGDTAVYDAMVRMAQDFSLRYPLVQGQGNFGSIDGDSAAAMRYCVTADTLVVTEKGLVAIGDLSDKEKIDVNILSKDKKVNKASKWFDSGNHETLRITTHKGYSLQGSYNHPVLTLIKDDIGRPAFCWKTLENINEGDIVVMDRSADSFWPKEYVDLTTYFPNQRNARTSKRVLPNRLNDSLAFILGALCAEGAITKDKIEFCNSDADFIYEFENHWNHIFPDSKLHMFNRESSSYGKEYYVRLECHYRYTIDFLSSIGLLAVKSNKKDIPPLILQSPKNVVVSFLRGYFEGDGSISSSKKMVELSCCSKSDTLIKNIQIILLRFGIDSFRRFDKYRNTYKLYLRGKKNVFRFYKEIGFISERKKKKLEFIILNYKKETSLTDYVPFISDFVRGLDDSSFIEKNNFDRYNNMEKNYGQICQILKQKTELDYTSLFEYLLTYRYLFEKVTCVEETEVHKVFSIKVESQCHSFIGNGFINHNTEARLSKISEELLVDIDKETVDWVPNFDGSLKEPWVLPAKLPNLLINGTSGIAVGMATNIPPHNIKEVIQGTIHLIDNPEATVKEIMQFVKGPDFPTAGMIQGTSGIKSAYETGRGRVVMKAKAHIEEKKNKKRIIVTEIPYMLNKSLLIEQIAALVRDKKIKGISNLRDESNKEGIRVVIELKGDANQDVVMNQLFKYSKLTSTFGINLLALVDNEPKTLNLKQIIQHYITHRQVVVRRRTQFELNKAEQRAHILEGLIIALDDIDSVIKKIKASKDVASAQNVLITDYKLSVEQAKAILDMRLQKLASLEQEKIRNEHKELLELIKKLKAILSSEQKILDIIKEELEELKEKYSDERRTEIIEGPAEEIEIEDLIKEEDMVITISHAGYIKRLPITTYKSQQRGGKGVIGASTKEEDFVEHLFIASTHAYILFFTNRGDVHWLKVYEIPEASRQAKGKAIVNLLNLEEGEKVYAFIPVREFDENHHLVLATKKGVVKKTNLMAYSRPRKGGIIAITLDKGDELVNAKLTDGNKQVLLATKNGMAVKFHEQDARPIGRTSRGVRGISLRPGDEVVSMVIADDNKALLTVTENGYGKRTPISDYRLINRGGVGVINIKTTERNGKVVGVRSVNGEDEVMLISKNGILIRTRVQGISVIGRNTQGVRLMSLNADDKVMALAKIVND